MSLKKTTKFYLLRVQEKIKEDSAQLGEGLVKSNGKKKRGEGEGVGVKSATRSQFNFMLLHFYTLQGLFTSSPSLFKLLKSV